MNPATLPQSLKTTPRLNRWVRFNADHSVTATFTAPVVSDPCADVTCAPLEQCARAGPNAGNCVAIASEPDAGMPELTMDAPAFAGLGSRRNYHWMARWIADPKSMRSTARMPKLLHGPKAEEDAEAIAAFLVSLKADPAPKDAKEAGAEQIEAGRKLFETLHCIACHNTPGTTENDPQKVSFNHVREKFAPGGLVKFLLKPEEDYAWIQMPNFKLTADEAARLAVFLESAADKPEDVSAPAAVAVLERGKKLTQTTGCLNCHTLKIESQFKTKSLADLTPDKWRQGCLAENADGQAKAPQFNLTSTEREALRAFAATDRASLARHVPAEFAERQARSLRCAECHGKFEGFPSFDALGGKLKPEWMKAFIGGELTYKPRPWIEARMPAFSKYAEGLAIGLTEEQGLPPRTSAEPPIDMETAKIGRKLVSANGGFFCVSCHAVGSMAAMQVFESNGINLAYTGARLQKEHYHRWVRNPLRIDPASKMPVYFDAEGRSPLTDYFNGDAEKQIEAIWQYIRLGDKMPPPETPKRSPAFENLMRRTRSAPDVRPRPPPRPRNAFKVTRTSEIPAISVRFFEALTSDFRAALPELPAGERTLDRVPSRPLQLLEQPAYGHPNQAHFFPDAAGPPVRLLFVEWRGGEGRLRQMEVAVRRENVQWMARVRHEDYACQGLEG